MSVGPLGFAGAAAGANSAQRQADVDRAQHDSANDVRKTKSVQAAEAAAGSAPTDGEGHESHERDADGRRLWEEMGEPPPKDEAPAAEPPRSKDPTGDRGGNLDLSG